MSDAGSSITAEQEESFLRTRAWRTLPTRLFITFAAIDTVFVAIYFLFIAAHRNTAPIFVLFNLDKEGNLPSWYAGTQLFVVAIGYLVLGSRLIPSRARAAALRPLWLLMGLGFTLLSADEVGAVHERMSYTLYRMKIFNFKFLDQWMVLYVGIAVVIAIAFSPWIYRFLRDWRVEVLIFIVGFGVLASGAFAAEVVQISRRWVGMRHLLEIGIEEWLEMFGVTILMLVPYRILSWVMTTPPEHSADLSPVADAGAEA
jgi:hypothetical protein